MKISRNFYTKPIFWIWLIIVFNCIYRAMIHFLGVPDAIAYLSDFAWIILGVSLLKHKTPYLYDAKTIRALLILLFLETVVGYFLNLYNPLVYLWGFRTFFRYIIFFLACCCYLHTDDIDKFLRFFYGILFINVIACVYEYVMGYGWDSISGLYSAGRTILGGAAGLNVLMCIVSAYLLIQYIYKEISLAKMIVPIMLCMLMASLSEQKAFYFEFILILVLCMLLTKFSLKKLGVVIAGIAVAFVGFSLYARYYGNMNDIYSWEAMMAYAGVDGSTYGKHLLNRTTALPYVMEVFLQTPTEKLLGLGLGYGDNVSVSLISSGFFKKYNYLGYQYFFTSLEGVNIGILGLILYYELIIAIFIYARKKSKGIPEELKKYPVLAQVMCFMAIFISVYNQALILDMAAFNIYLILAIPFILAKEEPKRG